MANKKIRALNGRSDRRASKRVRRTIALKIQKERKARLQLEQQQEEQGNGNSNGSKLSVNNDTNTDQYIDNLVGYNLGCCPITSRYYKAYLCSKCLLWFHCKCIYITNKDREAIKNNQWVCNNCKEQVSVIVKFGHNEAMKRPLGKVHKKNLEVQNKEKSLALKPIDDLKLKNRALEMKLREISKWVKDKFGADIPEEIETEAEMAFDYIKVLREQHPSFSKSPVIELNRISGIEDKTSESTMKNLSLKTKTKKMKVKKRPLIRISKSEPVICHYCEKSFVRKWDLGKHIMFVHENMKLPPGQNVICHYCGKSVRNYRLRQHINRIHELGPERLKCPEENCCKVFATKKDLDKHTKSTHYEPAEYLKCTEEGCLKRFKDKRYLKSHLEIHAAKGVRNFACPMCDKTFVTRNCLAAHKRMSHAKEMNHEFMCTFEGCHLGYSYRKYLEDHLKTHDPNYQPPAKQKLIICQFCAKEYETFPQLNRHILNVHEK